MKSRGISERDIILYQQHPSPSKNESPHVLNKKKKKIVVTSRN